MKALVAVKQVANLDDDFELRADGRGVDPEYIEWTLNEWDACALEEALRLRESAGTGEVVVISVGPERSEDAIRTCLAKGADRGIRIWDEALVDSDALAIARALAAAIDREAPDVVFCGVQSSDSVQGATGVALAAYLDLPSVAVVKQLEYDAAASKAVVQRELEGGLVEVIETATPAVLTVQTGINQPRYANLRAIKLAAEKPLERVGLEELNVNSLTVTESAGSAVLKMQLPERAGTAEMIEGPAEAIARRITEIVKERL